MLLTTLRKIPQCNLIWYFPESDINAFVFCLFSTPKNRLDTIKDEALKMYSMFCLYLFMIQYKYWL